MCLGLLEKQPVEHGEEDVLLGFGELADALELALELGGGPALGGGLAGAGRGHAQEHIGGHIKERGQRGDERDGDPEPPDLVVGEGLLGDAQLGGHGLLGEASLLAELGQAAAERFGELPVGGGHIGRPRCGGCGLHDKGGGGGRH